MRLTLIAAASVAALMATPAFAQTPEATPAPAAAPAQSADGEVSDAELASFAEAAEGLSAVGVQGAPTPEQEAQMAAAITGAGLTPERYNAIATAVAGDPVLQARARLATAEPSAPGSVGAGVTDAELAQYASASAAVDVIKEQIVGGTPTPEQQTALAEAITSSGLEVERYNAITAATGDDAHLRARIDVAKAGVS